VWKDFDDQFFQLPKEKMLQKIIEKKQYIINRLNADFQKVYFGKTLVRTLPLVCVSCVVLLLTNVQTTHRAARWWIWRR
jgi:enoyl reductase-like protein